MEIGQEIVIDIMANAILWFQYKNVSIITMHIIGYNQNNLSSVT